MRKTACLHLDWIHWIVPAIFVLRQGYIKKFLSWKTPVEGIKQRNGGSKQRNTRDGTRDPNERKMHLSTSPKSPTRSPNCSQPGVVNDSTSRVVVVGKQHLVNFGGFRELPVTVSTSVIHFFSKLHSVRIETLVIMNLSRCHADAQQRMQVTTAIKRAVRRHKSPPWYHLDCQQTNRFFQPIAARALLSTKSMRPFTLREVESPVNVNW
jgi:hypothetical protein